MDAKIVPEDPFNNITVSIHAPVMDAKVRRVTNAIY